MTTIFNGDKVTDWRCPAVDSIAHVKVIHRLGAALCGAGANPDVIGIISKEAVDVLDLQPERTQESFLSWQLRKDAQLSMSIFHYTQQNLIRLANNSASAPGASYQNTVIQDGGGIELELHWDASHNLRLSGYYAYQKSIDEVTKHDAGHIPHYRLHARADWPFILGLRQMNAQVSYVAKHKKTFGDARPQIPDNATADLTRRTGKSKRGCDFAASVREPFGADAREPTRAHGTALSNDRPMRRRSLWLQARHSC